MKRLQFDLLVENILLAEGSTPKAEVFQNKKFNLTKFKDKAEDAKEAMKMLAGAKWLGGINMEKIESVFNNLIENLGDEPITYSDLVTIIDNSMRNSFTRADLRIKWGRQFRNMFERLNDIQETEENPHKNDQTNTANQNTSSVTDTPETNDETPTVSKPENTEISNKESLDLISKRFWEKILGEGEYSRSELVRMLIEDNPDLEDSDSTIKISDLIMSGFLKKTPDGNYIAVDPTEQENKEEEEEGEGSGEISTLDPDELGDDWGNENELPSFGDNEGRPFNV